MVPFKKSLAGKLAPIPFCEISTWNDDDHLNALKCFQISARRMVKKPYSSKSLGVDAQQLGKIAEASLAIDIKDSQSARKFFEEHFIPHRFDNPEATGLLTAYFEPIVSASKVQTAHFQFPLYRRPPDLIDINDQNRPEYMDDTFAFARKTSNSIRQYYDRAQIQAGILANKGLELFWLNDPIDIFFIHIQGSARLMLNDGTQASVSYSAKSGHPYTPIGKTLVELGELKIADVTMESIRQWLKSNPERRDEIFATNRSYIFFQQTNQLSPALGPVAAAGVALTPGRSLAIDRHIHTFGTPIWVETNRSLAPKEKPFQRLMIAQDTGSAIIGSERGDLFVGSGEEAGNEAGKVKHKASMIVFVPKNNDDNSLSKHRS